MTGYLAADDPATIAGIWAGIAFLLGSFAFAAVIIWQFMKTRRANATLAREDSYRKLAEEAVAAERQTGRELAELRERAAEIERILRQVE